MRLRRLIAFLGFSIGLFALLLQFAMTIPASLQAGRSLPLSLVYYFSFFTILTNILLVLIYLGDIARRPNWLNLFRKPVTRATAAACIALVMGFYHLVLADLWKPEGLWLFADTGLHYVTPVIYLLWFTLMNRSGSLGYRHIPQMLIYPVVYLIYAMLRGAAVGEYPYPVLEVNTIGYASVALNAFVLLILLSILCVAAIAVDRLAPRI